MPEPLAALPQKIRDAMGMAVAAAWVTRLEELARPARRRATPPPGAALAPGGNDRVAGPVGRNQPPGAGRDPRAAAGRPGPRGAPRPGVRARRGGNDFLVTEPLQGWRQVRLSDRRTRIDWAHCVQELIDVHYPQAERLVLVLDQLNTHSPASLYQAFPPTEAKRLADRLEIPYPPSTAVG